MIDEGRITVRQSGDELIVKVTGDDARKALETMFPNVVVEDGKTYLTFKSGKVDDDVWEGNIYYGEGRTYPTPPGVRVMVSDDYKQALVRVEPTENSARQRAVGTTLKREKHIYPELGYRNKRVRPLMLRAFKVYVTGVLDGSNGKDREFAKVERKKRGKGAPAQMKAVTKLHDLIDEERYTIEEYEPDHARDEMVYSVRPIKWYDKGSGLVWVRVGGGIQVSIHNGVYEGDHKGKQAWTIVGRAWGVREPGMRVDFDDMLEIAEKKIMSDKPAALRAAARKKLLANFDAASGSEQRKMVFQLTKELERRGVKLKRNKRLRLTMESIRNPAGTCREVTLPLAVISPEF
jgi:hypothetical protein